MSEAKPEFNREEFNRKMVEKKCRTLADESTFRLLKQTCQKVGSKFEVVLNPGDNCFGSNGRAIYNNKVTGRFDMAAYLVDKNIRDLKGPEATALPSGTYFVEYQIGKSGFFHFWEVFDHLKSPKPLASVSG